MAAECIGKTGKIVKESANLPCGYDDDFVSPVDDDLQCSICFLPLREPVLTRCGHRFCGECLQRHFTRCVLYLRTVPTNTEVFLCGL